ncbi:MAG: phosphoglycerate kinase [Firmicutes bacterium]|nr:phosphoglycerate kinase [Bacillota bacterium]
MPSFHTLDDMPNIEGKRVLVRVDFNVPIDATTGMITDDTRIRGALPTLQFLLQRQARVIVMSHRGRPKTPNSQDSLRGVAAYLQTLLPNAVSFVDHIVGDEVDSAIQRMAPATILMLENLRFDPREKADDPGFSQMLAHLADYYVDDAFGTAHRASASMVGVPQYLPSYAGRLMERELTVLSEILGHPDRPYWAIIGGAKVSDKVTLLGNLLDQVDGLIIGGGMANTFLAAQGFFMGESKVEPEVLPTAQHLLAQAQAKNIPVILPSDLVVATEFRADAPHRVVAVGQLGDRDMALDLGPGTISQIEAQLAPARTVLWNGPMGVFEWDAFAGATMAVAHTLATLSAKVVVGGGDSVAAVHKAQVADKLTHVSTGGGATLEFLEGKTLPGVAALTHEGQELR